MKSFMLDVVAAMLGVILALLLFAYATADSDTRVDCDRITGDPLSQTSCIIKHTLS